MTRWAMLFALLTASPDAAHPHEPLHECVELALEADGTTYVVGQRIRLTGTVKNACSMPIHGYVWLHPYLPKGLKTSALMYCHGALPCDEFLGSIANIEYINLAIDSAVLQPGESVRSSFTVALNPKNGRLVLDAPGDYEFRWVTWGIHRDAKQFLRERGEELTATAHVRVLPVPASEAEAFALYAEAGLAKIAQYDGGTYVNPVRNEEIGAARQLLARYPDSLYAAAIVPGLMDVLKSRQRQGLATPEDEQLLADLRDRVAVQPQP